MNTRIVMTRQRKRKTQTRVNPQPVSESMRPITVHNVPESQHQGIATYAHEKGIRKGAAMRELLSVGLQVANAAMLPAKKERLRRELDGINCKINQSKKDPSAVLQGVMDSLAS
jgi:hypothetical protein